jgi:hypothetical protein
MKILFRVALFWSAVLPCAAQAEQALADFVCVVVADDALPVQKAAAEELAHYIGEITGKELAVISVKEYLLSSQLVTSFFVGDKAAALALGKDVTLGPWKLEEYMLKTVPEGLVLTGSDAEGSPWSTNVSAGSMLAAYTLLDEYLGVHWFWPGDFGESVPKNADAKIPDLDVRKSPSFEIRSIGLGYPSSYHTRVFSDESRKWARRNRLGWVRSAVFGHAWFDAFNLRNDESFKAHPEWFALVNGERRPPQMCTTNPEVIDRMVEHVLEGKQQIMHISPSDGGGFCQCNNCTALDPPGVLSYDGKTTQLSDRIFTYANEIARRVGEKNPDKACGMFAYTFYNKPPLKIEKLEPNLYLSFVYQSAAHRDPENLAEWREKVSGWQKLGAKMVVREGWGNHYYHDMHFLHYDQIISNLSEANDLGFVAAYGEGSKNFASMAPNFWALTRMLWDPARDTEGLMDEYWQAAYGPVAAEMEAFFESYNQALNDNWAKRDRRLPTTGISYANVIGAWRRLIPEAAVAEAEKHIEAAAAKAPEGEYADRVRFHRFGHDYTRLMLELLESYRQLELLGVKVGSFNPPEVGKRDDPATRDALLHRAYELGEQREEMLLEHRDWAGPDEGLYAFTNDRGLRQWHKAVKAALGIDQETALTKEKLQKLAE